MTAWLRQGDCTHCGHCCTRIARAPIVRSERQMAVDPAFYRARGFQAVELDGETQFVLYAWLEAPCPEFRDNRCAIHATKPRTCAEFPRVPLDVVGTPCSYWFERGTERLGGMGSPYPSAEAQLLAEELAHAR